MLGDVARKMELTPVGIHIVVLELQKEKNGQEVLQKIQDVNGDVANEMVQMQATGSFVRQVMKKEIPS